MLLPIVFVLVGVVLGFIVMQARGSSDGDEPEVEAVERTANCSPVARGDAAATRPGETVLVDVLANDTDADGDSLVFQILKTEGGTAEIDDGNTPTDSADDRVAFTPAEPPVETATVEYQALDPQGGFGSSILTIAVNAGAVLPDGVRSALASDPAPEGSESGRCGDTADATTTSTIATGPLGPDTAAVNTTTTAFTDNDSTATSLRRRTATTRQPTRSNRTTTTRRGSTGGSPATTARPPSNGGGGPPTTDAPSVPAPGDGGGGPDTTSPPTTQRPPSDDPPHPCSGGRDTEECQRWLDENDGD